jgi:hypothetical protein
VCTRRLCKECRSQRILRESEGEESSGGQRSHTHVRTHSRGVRRGNRQRSRPWRLEILPRLGRKCVSSGGAVSAIRSVGEQIWTVGFKHPGEAQEEPTAGGD